MLPYRRAGSRRRIVPRIRPAAESGMTPSARPGTPAQARHEVSGRRTRVVGGDGRPHWDSKFNLPDLPGDLAECEGQ